MSTRMSTCNIVIIGAGSASFGPTTLATLLRNESPVSYTHLDVYKRQAQYRW